MPERHAHVQRLQLQPSCSGLKQAFPGFVVAAEPMEFDHHRNALSPVLAVLGSVHKPRFLFQPLKTSFHPWGALLPHRR